MLSGRVKLSLRNQACTSDGLIEIGIQNSNHHNGYDFDGPFPVFFFQRINKYSFK